jgi:hypothetical protein
MLLDVIYNHLEMQLKKYNDYFPKNQPAEALTNTILLMRLIFKNQIFIANHSNFNSSFTLHLKGLVYDAMVGRFDRFQELTAPFDENNFEDVLQSLCKLTDMISDEISNDNQYFRKPFMK